MGSSDPNGTYIDEADVLYGVHRKSYDMALREWEAGRVVHEKNSVGPVVQGRTAGSLLQGGSKQD